MRQSAGFCDHGPMNWRTRADGVLHDHRLAVKDLYAVKGFKNSAGSPDWFNTHEPASHTAEAVARLMDAGAEFAGFTVTDELAYSLEGNNEYFGKSENPKLPGHACGGSSMGSAAAVASHWADIGLGTDTGGSIRVPASYCGLYGMRPSHGTVSTEGLIGLAPRFDTVGWFTQSPELLSQIGQLLLPEQKPATSKRLVVDKKLLSLVNPELRPSLLNAIERIRPLFKTVEEVDMGFGGVYSELHEVFRILQGRAIANYHGAWLEETSPSLSGPVNERIRMALSITGAEVRDAEFVRLSLRTRLLECLEGNATLFLPTTPTTAPVLGQDTGALRPRLLRLTAIAGLTGSAQIHLPLLPQSRGHGISQPYGFSLLQAPGNDLGLLSLTETVTQAWNKEY